MSDTAAGAAPSEDSPRDYLEQAVSRLESAWRAGGPADISLCLPLAASPDERLRVLRELIKVDLEYRWRAARPAAGSASAAWRLDEYVARFPELGRVDELPLDLLAEEYRVRWRWGDRTGRDAFAMRMGRREADLLALLSIVDAELAREWPVPPSRRIGEPSAALPAAALSPSASHGRDLRPQKYDPRAPLPAADYRLQRLIGAGGMGKVYEALQKSLGRSVAIKALRKALLRQTSAVERFLDEARLLGRLQHPSIVSVHGLGRFRGGGYFIAMDLLPGPGLDVLVAQAPVAPIDAARWVLQVADAAAHAHDRGALHCDLKPSNVLLRDGNAVVTDFGLGRLIVDGEAPPGEVAGTAPFMAPEQADAYWGVIGPATDVYGLGALLYTLLTGQPPYRGSTAADVIAQVVSGRDPISPRALRPDVPAELEPICLRCLAKPPGDRFPTADAVAATLRQFLASS